MTRRHHRFVPAALLAAAVAVTAAGCGSGATASSAGSSGYTLRVGFISTLSTPSDPEGWAYQNGSLLTALKSQGVDKISFASFANGPNLTAALTGGSLDLGILGDTPAETAKASGVDTRLVNQSSVGQDTWLFTPKGGVTSIDQLKGKTVATQVGSFMYRYLVGVLAEHHLTGQVKITNIYTNAAVAALSSKSIAAYAAPAQQLESVLTAKGFPVIDKASVDHKDLLGTSVTVITSKALAAHPGLPAAWNRARTAAVGQIDQQSAAYYSFAAKATQQPVTAVKLTLPVSNYPAEPLTTGGQGLLQAVDDFLVANKLIKAPISLASWKAPGV